jgi:hypothetical protein
VIECLGYIKDIYIYIGSGLLKREESREISYICRSRVSDYDMRQISKAEAIQPVDVLRITKIV